MSSDKLAAHTLPPHGLLQAICVPGKFWLLGSCIGELAVTVLSATKRWL